MSATASFDLQSQNIAFEQAGAEEIVRWAVEHYGRKLCLSTSFQLGGMVLIDLLSRIEPSVPVFFVDTGFHFKETLEFRDLVRVRYQINLITLQPAIGRETFKRIYGDDRLYERNPTECCRINKIEPMERALKAYDTNARLAALRRDSSPERARLKILEERVDGVTLIHPLANWTREQTAAYLKEHDVPRHPLHAQGYKTIGCFPPCCTVPVAETAPERAGRWTGTGKSECGLHLVGRRRPAQDFNI
jgi:phosphoadenosine phosphosulfate reductase